MFKENFEGFESEFEDSDDDDVCQWWINPNCKPLYDPDTPIHVLEGIMP